MTTENEIIPAAPAEGLDGGRCAVDAGFGRWVKITDRLPKEGDVIACSAEHRAGGPMFWAGHIVETRQGFAVMETRSVPAQRFILTHDTLWLLLPPLPNAEVTNAPRAGK